MRRQFERSGIPSERKNLFKKTILNAVNIPSTKKQSFQFKSQPSNELKQFYKSLGIIAVKTDDISKCQYRIGTGIVLSTRMILTCAHNIIGELKSENIKEWVKNQQLRQKVRQNTFFYKPDDKIDNIWGGNIDPILGSLTNKFFIEQIIISPTVLSREKFMNDWAILIVKSNNSFDSSFISDLRIVYRDQSQLTGQALIQSGFYVGFSPKDSYKPMYDHSQITLLENNADTKNQIQHKAETSKGSSGGAIIFPLLVGRDQFQLYLVGIHKECDSRPKKKIGALLDKNFYTYYKQYSQFYEYKGRSAEFHKTFKDKFMPYSIFKEKTINYIKNQKDIIGIFQQISTRSVCLKYLMKEWIKLRNHYLFLMYNQSELNDKALTQNFQLITNFGESNSNNIDIIGIDIKKLPLKNFLQGYQDDFHRHLGQLNYQMMRAFQQFLNFINKSQYKLAARLEIFINKMFSGEMMPIRVNWSNLFIVLVKLLDEYTDDAVQQLLDDENQSILLEILQTFVQQENTTSFLVKYNFLFRIQQLSYEIKHRKQIEEQFIPSKKFIDYKGVYDDILDAFIQQDNTDEVNTQLINQFNTNHFEKLRNESLTYILKFLIIISFDETFNRKIKDIRPDLKIQTDSLQKIFLIVTDEAKKLILEKFKMDIVEKGRLRSDQRQLFKDIITDETDRDYFLKICRIINKKYLIENQPSNISEKKKQKPQITPYQAYQNKLWLINRISNLLQLVKFGQKLQQSRSDDQKLIQSINIKKEQLSLLSTQLDLLESSQQPQTSASQFSQKPEHTGLISQEPKERDDRSLKSKQYSPDEKDRYNDKIIDSGQPARDSEALCRFSTLDKVEIGDLMYDYIGLIRIQNEKTGNFLQYGSGTLIGRATVLTAFHTVQLFINNKTFNSSKIQFKLNNGISNVVKIQYSEKFDWAILFLQKELLQQQSIFTLITHNNHVQKSNLVGKNYYCQIIGYPSIEIYENRSKYQQVILYKSCGVIFIQQCYSSGFQYALSTEHQMSGSPIIIYPTGKLKMSSKGSYILEPFILGIHTEGHFQEEIILNRPLICEELYNHGTKIVKDILFTNIRNQLNKVIHYQQFDEASWKKRFTNQQKCSENNDKISHYFKTTHQNSIIFSNYLYHKNKIEFMKNYLRIVNKQELHMKMFLKQEIYQYSASNIYFKKMSYQNIFAYRQKQQFFHRLFDVETSQPSQNLDPDSLQKQIKRTIDIFCNVLQEFQTRKTLYQHYQFEKIDDMIQDINTKTINQQQIWRKKLKEVQGLIEKAQNSDIDFFCLSNFQKQCDQFKKYDQLLNKMILELIECKQFTKLSKKLAKFIILKKKKQILNHKNCESFPISLKIKNIQIIHEAELINQLIRKNRSKQFNVQQLSIISSTKKSNLKQDYLQNLSFRQFSDLFYCNQSQLYQLLKQKNLKATDFPNLFNYAKNLVILLHFGEIQEQFFHYLNLTTIPLKRVLICKNEKKDLQQQLENIILKPNLKKDNRNNMFQVYIEDLRKRASRLKLIQRLIIDHDQKEQMIKSLINFAEIRNKYLEAFMNDKQTLGGFLKQKIEMHDQLQDKSKKPNIQKEIEKLNKILELKDKKQGYSSEVFATLMSVYQYQNLENNSLLNINKIIYFELKLFSELSNKICFEKWKNIRIKIRLTPKQKSQKNQQ